MTKSNKAALTVAIFLIVGLYLYYTIPLAVSWGPGPNYKNVSVRTTVNITDSIPEIQNIVCNTTTLNLNAGSSTKLVCLVEIKDYNGGSTINGTNSSGVNATFYYYLNSSVDPNDNNTHYTNSTCALNGTPNGFYVNWSCSFDVLYYANNGSWYVNATVLDTHNSHNFTDSAITQINISVLYALNVTNLIDFGQLAVGDTTTNGVQANVTNFGNSRINVSVYGYGGEDPVEGANLAMICQVRNISVSSERYALTDAAYGSMTSITNAAAMSGLNMPQQTNDEQQIINVTYWKLQVSVSDNPYGNCNGTVVFSAELP